jgi:hypothetical protein
MVDNAVLADGVAGFCRMCQIPWNSRHKDPSALCETRQLDLSEKRRELS